MNSQNNQPYLVKDFIQEFRDRIGDTSRSVPPSLIITCLNTALRRLLRQKGLERLRDRHDTWELATINGDGTPAASWDLGRTGNIIDIRKIRFFKADDTEVRPIKPIYRSPDEFFDCAPLPQYQPCGDPQYYTIEQLGIVNRLAFNRPPDKLIAVDMKYNAFHPRITSPDDEILIAWEYMDVVTEIVVILHKIETTDQSTARALWEDVDVLTADLVEMVAQNHTAVGYKRVARSF